MSKRDRIENRIFTLISEIYNLDISSISNDYLIGGDAEPFNLEKILDSPNQLALVEFNMALEEEFPPIVFNEPGRDLADRKLRKKIVRGRATAGEVIDWFSDYPDNESTK